MSGVDVGVLHLDSYHGQVRGALSVSSLELGNYLRILPIQSMEEF